MILSRTDNAGHNSFPHHDDDSVCTKCPLFDFCSEREPTVDCYVEINFSVAEIPEDQLDDMIQDKYKKFGKEWRSYGKDREFFDISG